MSLFEELKRRNVFRVGIAYGGCLVVAAGMATVVPILKLPAWVAKPHWWRWRWALSLALILAWAYELTPEGIKPEAEVDRTQSISVKPVASWIASSLSSW